MSSPQFVLCPHCEGLLVCDPVNGQPPARCRHCGQVLEVRAEAVEGDDATRASVHAAQEAAQLAASAVPVVPAPLPITLADAAADDSAEALHGTFEAITAQSTDAANAHAPAVDGAHGSATSDRADNHDAANDRAESERAEKDRVETATAAQAGATGVATTTVVADTRTDATAADSDDAVIARSDASADAHATSNAADTAALAAMPHHRLAPRFATRSAASAVSTRAWSVVAALAAVLLLQLLLAQRATLAADARWRPLMQAMCGVLRCSLPAWHDPAAFEMLERNVAAAPAAPGVLVVSARFRQQARWPQAWPLLQVQLLDADGRVLAAGRFNPRDYLGHAPDTSLLAPGREVRARFDVREPPGGAVAFQFDFL